MNDYGLDYQVSIERITHTDGSERFNPVVKVISKEPFFDNEFALETAEDLQKWVQERLERKEQP